MQNLEPGRPGVIRPQVGQALGSAIFPSPATGDAAVAGGCDAVGVGGFGGPTAPPGMGGRVVGTGGFGGTVGTLAAGTGGLGGEITAGETLGGSALGGTGTGGFADAAGAGTGG